jgi:DNA-binding transcriptional MocR family regulator
LQAGFEDQTNYFVQLSERLPGLAGVPAQAAGPLSTAPVTALSAESQAALLLAERRGQVTPRILMDETGVSKATATRRLAELAESGFLVREGQGRGTYYVLGESHAPAAKEVAGNVTGGYTVTVPLNDELAFLRNTYAVTDIAVIEAPLPVTLRVHFSREPTFRQFVDMQQHLAEALKRPVHLEATVS